MPRAKRLNLRVNRVPLAIAVALCVSLMFAMGHEVSAAPKPAQPKVGPCIADIEKFCPNVPMGDGRRIYCLAKHLNQLAPACRERVPILQRAFEFGKLQQERTKKYLAKQAAAEAKARSSSTPTPKPK